MIPIWALAEQSEEELSRESLQKVGKVRVRPGRCPHPAPRLAELCSSSIPTGDKEASESHPLQASREDSIRARAVLGAGTPKPKVPSAGQLLCLQALLRGSAGPAGPAALSLLTNGVFPLGPAGSLQQRAGANALITGAEFSEESELLLNIRSQPFG